MRSWISVWNAFPGWPSPRIVSTIWVPATAQSFSVICDVNTAAGSSARLTSTATRGIGVGDGVGEAEGASVTSGVGDGDGSGVTTTVGRVARSGGGSIQFSIRARPSVEALAHAEDVGLDHAETGDEQDDDDQRGDRPAPAGEGVHGWLGRQ